MKTIIVKHLRKAFSSLQAVYLFGSYAQGLQTEKSDVDIAFLCDEKIDNVERWRIAEALASKLDRDVDLVDLHTASEVMRMQVVSGGKRIYVKDFERVEAFEDLVYMLYIDLNENRAGILEDIMKRGTVYR